ncbi:unnamed protein product [Cunninghamella blakesleeana]
MSKASKKKRSASKVDKEPTEVNTPPSKKMHTATPENHIETKKKLGVPLNKDLPAVHGVIDASRFITARMEEVNYLQSKIKQTSVALKVPAFEPIPRRMRRGPVSHVLYGLRARDRAKLSLKLSLGKKVRPSIRKIKSKAVLDELNSRKSGIRWLETHKWQIKRMKMENWWGFRLASQPMYKSRTITYRSFTKISLLHDASYLGCLQLAGLQTSIIQILNRISDPFLPSVGSERFIKGTRIGHTNIYKDGEYPYQYLCPITFLWRSKVADSNENLLWLWIHPSSFTIIEDQIKKLIPTIDESVMITDLRKELVRFELTGPKSLAILQAIIEPVEVNDDVCTKKSKNTNQQLWNDMKSIRSGCCLPYGSVIGLTIQDPRLKFPQKARPLNKEEVSTTSTSSILNLSLSWPKEASVSDIWDEEMRKKCILNKPTETQLSQRRGNNLLPGSKLTFTSEDVRVPILLIQRGGPLIDQPIPSLLSASRTEQIEGWTVIVPKGFGLPFWRSFVFAGARTGGLNDIHNMHFDSGFGCFPYDYPGTKAFCDYQSIKENIARQHWEKLPPAKRINYKKLNIGSPFKIEFDTLIPTAIKSNNEGDDSSILLKSDKLKSIIITEKDSMIIEKKMNDLMVKAAQLRNVKLSSQSISLEKMLINVCVKSIHGGTFLSGSMIYLIENEDLYKIFSNTKYSSADYKQILESKNHIGYITTGDYSFITGQGQGIGACSAIGLHRLYQLDSKYQRKIKLLVLIVNIKTQEFKSATVHIL